MLGVLSMVTIFIFYWSDASLTASSWVLSLPWFVSCFIDSNKILSFAGSVITDRALRTFISSIYFTAFHPQNYNNHVTFSYWWDTILFTSIHSTIKRAKHRIKFASLIGTVFVLAGLTSFVVEDLNLLPNHNRLSPLLGGMVVRNNWRDTLISQCWKRKKKRRSRLATSADVFAYLCRVREYDSADGFINKPTTYSSEHITSLVNSLDILDMNSMLEMFNNQKDPLLSTELHTEVTRLHSITSSINASDPMLSSMDTLLYNSVIPQVVMDSMYLSADEASMPIVIDTGASRSISPHKSDFIEFRNHSMDIGTINASSKVEGTGIIRWKVTDQNNVTSTIETAAYYIPSASIRLYSPQYHFRECCGGSLKMDNVSLDLHLPHQNRNMKLSFPYNSVNNLPMMLPSHHPHFTSAMFSACPSGDVIHAAINKLTPILKDVPVVEHFDFLATQETMDHLFLHGDQRANLSSAQLELRLLHNRMGHVHMKRVQKLVHHEKPLDSQQSEGELNPPVVFRSRFAKTKTCSMPLCRSCALSKMTKQKTNTQHHTNDPAKEMALQREHLSPGDCISWDQYVVPHRGRLYKSAGRERESLRFGGGSLAVDHASKRVFIHHQTSLDASHTLVGKRLLERDAREVGVKITRYHADNGIFASSEFKADCELKEQKLTFSASNSHHQNGVAERYIGTISRMARAMLIHQALLWPRRHNVNLWPMAMDYAVWLWNNLPMDDGISPEEKWTGTKFPNYDHLRRAHVFGCPCYVLNPKLVEGHANFKVLKDEG